MQTKSLKEARELIAAAQQKIQTLRAKIDSGTWDDSTDKAALDAAKSELEKGTNEAQIHADIENAGARAAGWVATATTDNERPVNVAVVTKRGDSENTAKSEFRFVEAIRQAATGNLEGFYREMDQEGRKEARQLALPDAGSGNLSIPSFLNQEKRDITATTTTTGGHTIQTDLMSLISFLDPRLSVREMGATYMGGLTGNVAFPRNDAAATAVWASAENTASTETTPTFDQVTMSPKRITAFTDVSKQNLVQTSIGMENFVRGRLTNARDNLLETACFTGTGSSGQPTGLLTVSGTNDITLGANGAVLTWANVVDFETQAAIDNADMGTLGYLFTPGVAGLLKTTKRDVAGNGFIWDGPNRNALVNGYKAMATNFLPSNLTKGSGSNLHAALFGNWAELIIGQWGGLDLMVNPYTKGKEALVEIIIHCWHDLAVRHAVSFTKCDEIALS